MDKKAVHAAEAFVHVGYPLHVEALLIVEVDGPRGRMHRLIEKIAAIASANDARDAPYRRR